MRKQSYYQLLKPHFLKIVEAYKDDFTVNDRKHLHPAKDIKWAISGMRPHGTNLITDIKISQAHKELNDEEFQSRLAFAHTFMFKGENQHFFICEFGAVFPVPKEAAIEFFKKKTGYGRSIAA